MRGPTRLAGACPLDGIVGHHASEGLRPCLGEKPADSQNKCNTTPNAGWVIGLKGRIKTITLDNGTEFHGYKSVQDQFGVEFFFATPYHAWERGSNENMRQYLPKGTCLKDLTQAQCNWIANELNNRPRERLGFRTPAEAFRRPQGVALQS